MKSFPASVQARFLTYFIDTVKQHRSDLVTNHKKTGMLSV